MVNLFSDFCFNCDFIGPVAQGTEVEKRYHILEARYFYENMKPNDVTHSLWNLMWIDLHCIQRFYTFRDASVLAKKMSAELGVAVTVTRDEVIYSDRTMKVQYCLSPSDYEDWVPGCGGNRYKKLRNDFVKNLLENQSYPDSEKILSQDPSPKNKLAFIYFESELARRNGWILNPSDR